MTTGARPGFAPAPCAAGAVGRGLRQLELDHVPDGHAALGRVDHGHRAPVDAERPREPPHERRTAGAARPLERDAAARGHRTNPIEQGARRRLEPQDGPRRRVARGTRRKSRRPAQGARELVDARPSRAHLDLARPGGDPSERLSPIGRQVGAAESQRFAQRGPQRVDLRSHGQGLTLKQLGRGVLRSQALRGGASLLPRRRETEIDEGPVAIGAHDHVRRLDVAVQQARPVHDRELVARRGDGLEPGRRAVLEHVLQAGPEDQLAQHVAPAAVQRPEGHHPGHPQPLEAAQRDRLSHQRADLVLAGVARQELEREHLPAHAIADRPDLAPAARAEAAQRLVTRRQIRHCEIGPSQSVSRRPTSRLDLSLEDGSAAGSLVGGFEAGWVSWLWESMP